MANKLKQTDGSVGKPFKKEVLVGLSKEAKDKKLERIAEALGEKKQVKAEAKLATSDHRTRINELDKEMETLREQVATSKELRSVSVVEHKDYRRNVVEIARADTREVVETREMTVEERQQTFPDAPRGAKARGKAALKSLPPRDEESAGDEARE